jgi:putative peptidoglycan lipid II flippase
LALWAGADLLDPWLTGAMVQRYIALAALVGAGVALYGLASVLTGAYRLSDIKALMRRKSAT